LKNVTGHPSPRGTPPKITPLKSKEQIAASGRLPTENLRDSGASEGGLVTAPNQKPYKSRFKVRCIHFPTLKERPSKLEASHYATPYGTTKSDSLLDRGIQIV